MVRIFSKLNEQAARYASVARWAKPLAHIAAVLEPDEDKTSETVEWEMTQLLEWLKQTYTDEQDSPMVTNVLNYSRGFWKGLFACYDHYHIPRTNNDLEQFFRRMKAVHRRITGLRNWNSYIVRNGEMIVLIDDALRQKHAISRLRTVGYERYAARKARWGQRLSEGVLRRRFNRQPHAFLEKLEAQWEQLT